MKNRKNARQKRDAETLRRKGIFSPGKAAPHEHPAEPEPTACKPDASKPDARKPAPVSAGVYPQKTPEEETREFLDYLDRHHVPFDKEELPQGRKKKPVFSGSIPRLNLEEGMPPAEEALGRMNIGLQELRVSRVKAVKLIHGYGSTGRGGRIRDSVRSELASLKRRKLIRDWIPGEDFGPMDPASRRLAEQESAVTRDPDYGRMNHGISIVVL